MCHVLVHVLEENDNFDLNKFVGHDQLKRIDLEKRHLQCLKIQGNFLAITMDKE